MPAPSRRSPPVPIRDRDPSDPAFKSVELAQRGRMILDVAAADLEMAEEHLGPFHETTWHFRNALAEARRSWDRLRAEFGSAALDAALAEPPLAILTIGEDVDPPRAIFLSIGGKTYRVERIAGTDLAPALWRLTRLPLSEDGPYYVARLRDGTYRCDCAEWTYQVAQIDHAPPCKHVTGLLAMGWI
ncbi:MAG: hypothetical protein JWN86_1886 [Planctomycetota bacterium]|nr:hypothetical protein [Planctomycetota bacterium]